MADVKALRDAILAAPLETSSFGEEPLAGTLYVPLSHIWTPPVCKPFSFRCQRVE